MNFFAIVKEPRKVFRIGLSQTVQHVLTNHFEKLAGEFTSENIVTVPFERENFKADETEVVQIQGFNLPDEEKKAISDPQGCPVLSVSDNTAALSLSPSQVISQLFCLFACDAEKKQCIFQIIRPSQRISPDRLSIFFSNNTFSRLEDPGLVIGDKIHAVFTGDQLLFKSFYLIRQLFDISGYYREATDADIERFITSPCFHVQQSEELKQLGPWFRSRIAAILDAGTLDQYSPRELFAKAQAHGVKLTCIQEHGVEKIMLPAKGTELRTILKFLDEERYIGPLSGRHYETNSKRLM